MSVQKKRPCEIALQNRLDSDNPAFIQCKTSAT